MQAGGRSFKSETLLNETELPSLMLYKETEHFKWVVSVFSSREFPFCPGEAVNYVNGLSTTTLAARVRPNDPLTGKAEELLDLRKKTRSPVLIPRHTPDHLNPFSSERAGWFVPPQPSAAHRQSDQTLNPVIQCV